ncbi:phosducin-like protein [Ambystoma mexicanum]|uniref:phosducin-like protein n=1 Tax=Ambystoma mexicanum TaxID=8296 RepID=UPI0037E91A08
MATLDDKLLGEKSQYYYSSSEDEGSSDREEEEEAPAGAQEALQAPEAPEPSRDGLSVNTGPKGVMQDWRRFKQLQAEQRAAQRLELEQLVKRLSMTCRSQLDEERDRERGEGRAAAAGEAGEEEEQDFLERYRRQRMEEMRRQQQQRGRGGRRFGQLLELDSGQAYLDAVDGEAAHTLVLVHIYEEGVRGAEALQGCLACLAAEYPALKVCQVRSALLGTSARFTGAALPALLAYRARQLVGNFLRLTDQLGEDFYALDLEAFLQECGLLPDKEPPGPGGLGEAAAGCGGEDSDLDID